MPQLTSGIAASLGLGHFWFGLGHFWFGVGHFSFRTCSNLCQHSHFSTLVLRVSVLLPFLSRLLEFVFLSLLTAFLLL